MLLVHRLMIALAVITIAYVAMADDAEGAQYDINLTYQDARSVKVATGLNPVNFNFSINHTGDAFSQEVVVDTGNVPAQWGVFYAASPKAGPAIATYPSLLEFLIERGEGPVALSMTVSPYKNALNGTYWMTLKAWPKEDPGRIRSYTIGVIIPQRAGFELEVHNPPPDMEYRAVPPSTVTIQFALYNTGNGLDRFLIQGACTRQDAGWTFRFTDGVDEFGWTLNITADPHKLAPHIIEVEVTIPPGERAYITASVTVNATSRSDTTMARPPARVQVTALQFYDFDVFVEGPSRKDAEAGGTASFQLRIWNKGNGPDTFTILAVFDPDLNPGFVARAEPSSVTVEVEENVTVDYVVEVPDYPPKKEYFFTAEVGSESEMLAPVTKSFGLWVPQFYRLELSSEDPNRIANPGDSIEFEVKVTNTGNGLDNYVIEVVDVPYEWLTYLQPPEVTLLQNQRAVIKVIVIIPSAFEGVFMTNYTLLLEGRSTRSEATNSTELHIDIPQFYRIEWTYRGRDLTSFQRPVVEESYVRPMPEVDIVNKTPCAFQLGVRNYGNGPDTVNVSAWSDTWWARVSIKPSEFVVNAGETVHVDFSVMPGLWTIGSGIYKVVATASSSDPGVANRTVTVLYSVAPVFPPSDFVDLSYTDPTSDDYQFYREADREGGKVIRSRGRLGTLPGVDIVSMGVAYDEGTRIVNVTMELSGDVIDRDGVEYWVLFVWADQTMNGPLLVPKSIRKGQLNASSLAPTDPIVWIVYRDGQAAFMIDGQSVISPHYIEAEVDGNRLVISVYDAELRLLGMEPGSGFGVMAVAVSAESSERGFWWERVTWDSAGMGAAVAPEGFTREPDSSRPPPYLGLVVLVVAVTTVSALWILARGRRRAGPQ